MNTEVNMKVKNGDVLQRIQVFLFLVPFCIAYQNYYKTTYRRISGYRLRGHVMGDHQGIDLLDCGIQCSVTNGCQSYNFQNKTMPQRCEMNSKKAEDAPVDFHLDGEYNYYTRDSCNPNPCKNGGTCHHNVTFTDFWCQCTIDFDGRWCQKYVSLGALPKKPGQSCQHIKDVEVNVPDGPYWIDPGNSGKPFRVYCDMTTEGGGWLLVSNIVIPNPVQKPAQTLTYSFRDISNYENNHTFISATNLHQLQLDMPFTQLRFQCYKRQVGRMVHVITSQDPQGSAVINYFTAQTDVNPDGCGSFTRGPGDASMLAQKCAIWGNGNAYGKWGHYSRRNKNRLFDHPFYVVNKFHWMILGVAFGCDDDATALSFEDFWKIFVR